MPSMKVKPRRSEKGASLLVGITSLVMIVPLTGLTIDVGILYAVRSKIQGAVDGAALSAARALNLGQNLAAQTTAAQNNATTWFNANFPTGTWSTVGTTLGTVNINTSPTVNGVAVSNMVQITIAATTNVNTYFMRWLHFDSTLVGATGQTMRRDINAMLVLDRSFSMTTTSSCANLISAAKQFTGAFVPGRDRIGAITFNEGTYLLHSPSTDFQTTLGYTNTTGSGTGALDNIVCTGTTGTPAAIMEGYNELFKLSLPGAYNVLVIETDGMPNTMTMNFGFDDSPSSHVWTSLVNRGAATGCQDNTGKQLGHAPPGFTTIASRPAWSPAHSMNTGGTGFMANIPSGMVGSIMGNDPPYSSTNTYSFLLNPYSTSASSGFVLASNLTGCTTGSTANIADIPDISWLPTTDVYGNQLNPALHPYLPVSTTTVATPAGNRTYVDFHASGTLTATQRWTNMHNAALNASDNAAFRVRQGFTLASGDVLAPTIFVIGLGGNTGSQTPDYTLMQRWANDPDGDPNGSLWNACSSQPGCVNYPATDSTYTQPQGTFIWAADKSKLGDAFRELASQVLRISK